MRSSKSRSRSKSNRPRTLGNITNRVFDSSGPEGKVRGTPQQIIDKYLILARDAQLSNDRVAAENFLQHAEHYTRMLSEAQRELAAEQEARRAQDQQQRDRQDRNSDQPQTEPRHDNRNSDSNADNRPQETRPEQSRAEQPRAEQPRSEQPRRDQRQDRASDAPSTDQSQPGHDVIDLAANEEDGNGLVETPETARPSRGRPPRRRSEAAAMSTADAPVAAAPAKPRQKPGPKPKTQDAAPAAAEGGEKPARQLRRPRKPKDQDSAATGDPRAAAE